MVITKVKFHLYVCLWLAFVWGGYLSTMGSSLWAICVIMATLGMMPFLWLAERTLFPAPPTPRPVVQVVHGKPGKGAQILRFHFPQDKNADPDADH